MSMDSLGMRLSLLVLFVAQHSSPCSGFTQILTFRYGMLTCVLN